VARDRDGPNPARALTPAATVAVMSEETDDRERRLAAVERELRRARGPGEERDLVETVGDEQRRDREREAREDDGEE
jgi:hypothetical protein